MSVPPDMKDEFGLIRQLEPDHSWSVPPIVYRYPGEDRTWRAYSYVVLPQTWEPKISADNKR